MLCMLGCTASELCAFQSFGENNKRARFDYKAKNTWNRSIQCRAQSSLRRVRETSLRENLLTPLSARHVFQRFGIRATRNSLGPKHSSKWKDVFVLPALVPSLGENRAVRDIVWRVEGIADSHSHRYRASGTTGRRLWIIALLKGFLAKNDPKEDSFLFGDKYDQMAWI